MKAEDKVKKLLEFAARAVLMDTDDLKAAIDEAKRNLPRGNGLDRSRAAADVEMARRVLTYTAAYADVMKEVTRDYRRKMIHAGAVEDALKRG